MIDGLDVLRRSHPEGSAARATLDALIAENRNHRIKRATARSRPRDASSEEALGTAVIGIIAVGLGLGVAWQAGAFSLTREHVAGAVFCCLLASLLLIKLDPRLRDPLACCGNLHLRSCGLYPVFNMGPDTYDPRPLTKQEERASSAVDFAPEMRARDYIYRLATNPVRVLLFAEMNDQRHAFDRCHCRHTDACDRKAREKEDVPASSASHVHDNVASFEEAA